MLLIVSGSRKTEIINSFSFGLNLFESAGRCWVCWAQQLRSLRSVVWTIFWMHKIKERSVKTMSCTLLRGSMLQVCLLLMASNIFFTKYSEAGGSQPFWWLTLCHSFLGSSWSCLVLDKFVKHKCLMFCLTAAAIETTLCGSIEWGVVELVNNPKIQKKIYAELYTILGKENLITESDTCNNKLPYLTAFVK